MYGRAAENCHSGAQFNFAVFHEYGLGGLCVDKHEALRWYKTAAENGNVNAKNNLEYLQKELASGKGNPNLLGRLFADLWVSKQPTGGGGIMPRCLSSPGRLFMQSDLNSTESLHEIPSSEQKSIAYEDSKCVWVI